MLGAYVRKIVQNLLWRTPCAVGGKHSRDTSSSSHRSLFAAHSSDYSRHEQASEGRPQRYNLVSRFSGLRGFQSGEGSEP